jgi:nucleotide-binding universal stress UspA family protein
MSDQGKEITGPIRRVICAVRGGPESRATVTRAIQIALENEARLTFFHVVDAEFLGHVPTGSALSVIYSELNEMAQFTMLILMDRAQRRGVLEVDYAIREGDIRRQLMTLARETSADLIVMGQPIRSPGSNVFTAENYRGFITQLEESGDTQIFTVYPG